MELRLGFRGKYKTVGFRIFEPGLQNSNRIHGLSNINIAAVVCWEIRHHQFVFLDTETLWIGINKERQIPFHEEMTFDFGLDAKTGGGHQPPPFDTKSGRPGGPFVTAVNSTENLIFGIINT